MYKLEFYRESDAEESDPDIAEEIFADNHADLEDELARRLEQSDVILTWIDDAPDGMDSFRVTAVDGSSLGVAYIGDEKVFL